MTSGLPAVASRKKQEGSRYLPLMYSRIHVLFNHSSSPGKGSSTEQA
nr:hypothetical protein [Sunxiuqinia sp.]